MAKAAALAATAHAGQTLHSSHLPYITHPVRVAMIVRDLFRCDDDSVIAAAFLHDTTEKTAVTLKEILDRFGPEVAGMVDGLSKRLQDSKKDYWNRLTVECWQVRLVKMADALDHLDCSIQDLPRRIRSGHRALALASTNEEPLQRARHYLKDELARAAFTLKKEQASAANGNR